MRIEEYDDGYDSAASFEAAGADRPEDMEPAPERIRILVTIDPAENGEFLRSAEDIKADLIAFATTMAMGGESLGYGVRFEVLRDAGEVPAEESGHLPLKDGEGWGPYAPRRLYDESLPYLESDYDYMAHNRELAVKLLDNYGVQWHGRCEEEIPK